MATQVPALISSTSSEKSVRRIAEFHPCLWGNQFLTCNSIYKTIDSATEAEYKALKQEIKGMITAKTDKHVQKFELINTVQRLGVAYHFEEEIENALQNIYHDLETEDDDDNDLYTVSLRFRLLRQQGIRVSCDVFEKFRDGEGKFKASLTNDVEGMLSLYEAAYLGIHGEEILDEAIAFTTTHLKSLVSDVNPNLVEQINHALYRPVWRVISRLEARYFMGVYPRDDSHDKDLLKFAKLDFNILQARHQNELSSLTRWWRDLDFATKLPYARDRLVELFFWIVATYFEPQYAFGRRMFTKVICMISILDDTFDSYGTYEELKIFTEAVTRWDFGAIDSLPEYMKLIYKTLLDVYDEIEEDMTKEGKPYSTSYAKKTMQDLVQAYFQEATWFNEGYVPTMEEYISVALTTATYFSLITTSFLGMGHFATKEAFEWMSKRPKIAKASSYMLRLMNDLNSHDFEQKRGHVASAVECYMKQHGVSIEQVAKVFSQEIANAWKCINEEILRPTVVPFPLLERILNLTRVSDLMYEKDHDGYTHSNLVKDQVALILRDPVML